MNNAVSKALSAFPFACNGNVAITFALALIPMVGLTGAAVDYSRGNAVKSDMQSALDATALMLAKNPSLTSMSAGQLQTTANNYFKALFTRPEAQNTILASPIVDLSNTSLTLSATSIVKTSFMKLINVPDLAINGTSTVAWGMSRLRVALVLDNTGSMASAGKITALKTAAHNLLDQLKQATSQNGDVYVSIVPFAKDVNVDPANYKQSWIDFKDHGSWQGWASNNGSCNKLGYNDAASCKAAQGAWTSNKHNTWNGCVTDRDQDYDTNNTPAAKSNTATLFPAEQYGLCPVPVMGLSYDWTALNAKIDEMQPNGTTNQAIGLQWGWFSLTSAPFTIPAMDPKFQYQQIIILLSDGLNTQDRWYGNGSTQAPEIDARQKIVCDNIKAAGITIYTIQVNTDGSATSSILQNCASDSNKFFILTSAGQLVTTFSKIGSTLSQLRIAK